MSHPQIGTAQGAETGNIPIRTFNPGYTRTQYEVKKTVSFFIYIVPFQLISTANIKINKPSSRQYYAFYTQYYNIKNQNNLILVINL